MHRPAGDPRAREERWELFDEHPSCTTVRNRLRALGIDRRGKPWNDTTIEKMLANPIYAGYFRDADGQLVKGIHEAKSQMAVSTPATGAQGPSGAAGRTAR